MDGPDEGVEDGPRIFGGGDGGVSRKLYHALSTPEAIPWYLAAYSRGVRRAARNGGIPEAARYLPELFGLGTYWRYLRRQSEDGLVRRPVRGFEMWLPVEDTGLARELVWRGVHEPAATALYGRLLSRLADHVGTVTVLDVGTNIGYFPLLALEALPGDARLLGVEPNPRARELLERNLELNGYRDRADVDELALSDRDGTAPFYLSEATNWSKLGDPPTRHTGTVIDVEVRTGDAYLRERGVDPGAINVVRMDVEGHELDLLEGMPAVLAAESPLLLFVEFHVELRDRGRLEAFVDLLERHGIELERGVQELDYRPARTLTGLEELSGFPFEEDVALQLFLRKGW